MWFRLENNIFIPFDIFKQRHQNKPVTTQLEAWLTFPSTDEPDKISEFRFLALSRISHPFSQPSYDILTNLKRFVKSS
jgi:hypothetical protein